MEPLVEIVSKLVIKPSSPTPKSLSRYTLSSTDRVMPLVNISIAFFYPNTPGHEGSTIGQQLQNSLSKTLVSYYPFAGRLVENDYINCNDQGVDFVEVKIHCPIHDIMQNTQSYVELILPREIAARKEDSLVAVQLSHFDCGGVAIALSISHKIADASTSILFMNYWASSTCLSYLVPDPLLVADSLFPHRHDILLDAFENPKDNCVLRRFFFSAEEIGRLKTKAVESGIQNPTRVEVVTALLYQCIMVSKRCTNYSLSQPTALLQAVNLRPFLGLPKNSVGNIVSFFFCINKDEHVPDFLELVGQLRKAKLELKNHSKENLSYDLQMGEFVECLKLVDKLTTLTTNICSSWCGFPVYDVDFGFGKPTLVSEFLAHLKDIIVLIDSVECGIEALVNLEEEQMSAFETNEDLLSFASLCSAK